MPHAPRPSRWSEDDREGLDDAVVVIEWGPQTSPSRRASSCFRSCGRRAALRPRLSGRLGHQWRVINAEGRELRERVQWAESGCSAPLGGRSPRWHLSPHDRLQTTLPRCPPYAASVVGTTLVVRDGPERNGAPPLQLCSSDALLVVGDDVQIRSGLKRRRHDASSACGRQVVWHWLCLCKPPRTSL